MSGTLSAKYFAIKQNENCLNVLKILLLWKRSAKYLSNLPLTKIAEFFFVLKKYILHLFIIVFP